MLSQEHLSKLKQGAVVWNAWRKACPREQPQLESAKLCGINLNKSDLSLASLVGADLSRSDLSWANLIGADLSGANLHLTNMNNACLRLARLRGANLVGAKFVGAELNGADLSKSKLRNAVLLRAGLSEADLRETNLQKANLQGAHLTSAKLCRANLSFADLSEALLLEADLSEANLKGADLRDADFNAANLRLADLSGANLERAVLVDTHLEGSTLANCRIYGISAWNVRLEGAVQTNLIITPEKETVVEVDGLEVAQFIYLLLNNRRLRDVIDTIGKKAVLILGRFTAERKCILDAIRGELRRLGYLPILFDFETPSARDTQETIVTLAGLSRFIVADITDPKSIPQELATVVPNFPSVPVQPLLQTGFTPWGMFDHIRRYDWVLPIHSYDNERALLAQLSTSVIVPAEKKANERTGK